MAVKLIGILSDQRCSRNPYPKNRLKSLFLGSVILNTAMTPNKGQLELGQIKEFSKFPYSPFTENNEK